MILYTPPDASSGPTYPYTYTKKTLTMQDSVPGLEKIEDFLRTLTKTGGLNLKFNILASNGQVQRNPGESAGESPPVSTNPSPDISVECTGPDTPLLTARNGETPPCHPAHRRQH